MSDRDHLSDFILNYGSVINVQLAVGSISLILWAKGQFCLLYGIEFFSYNWKKYGYGIHGISYSHSNV